MPKSPRTGQGKGRSSVALPIGLTVLALAAAVVVSVVLVFRFIADERERDLLSWEARMGIVASSRSAAIEQWIARQFSELKGLADNPSVAIYFTQASLSEGAESPEAGYLRNLLAVTASRTGFSAPPTGPEVRANVRRIGVAGLAVLDMKGRMIVATPNPPPVEGALRAFVALLRNEWTSPDGRALLDIHRAPSGRLTMAFAVPVFAIQSRPVRANQIGVVLGVKPIDKELYPLLRQPGAVEKTAEAVLVRRSGDVIGYLSPLRDGSAPLARKMALNTPKLAAAFALRNPDGFGTARDYRGQDVLVVPRKIGGTPWTLLYKVDVAEALGPSETRLRGLLALFLLAITLTAAAIVAVWYKGASKRASDAAARFEDMAQRYEQQRNFLRLVTDSQPNATTIIDENGHVRFANAEAGRRAGMKQDDMLGKSLSAIHGAERARLYERLNRDALDDDATAVDVHRFEEGGAPRVYQSLHVPMAETDALPRGVLLVEEDITGAITERERRERILQQLTETLVTVVDHRDHHAARHSQRVALIAEAVAREMAIEPVLVETARVAGVLMNLGKILVPIEVLTKSGRLSATELRHVRDSILMSAELLEGIEFDGPVVETLRQCQERYDGKGFPKGLKGRKILPTARVVALANAFVALTSPRAHRPGLDIDAALEALLAEVGKAYDRKVVGALVNYVENRGGREAMAALTAGPASRKPRRPRSRKGKK